MSFIENSLPKTAFLTAGVKFMFISTACFTVMQVGIKQYSSIHVFEHAFFRSLITWLLSVVFLLYARVPLIGKHQKLLFFRSLVGTVSMFCFFYMLQNMPLGSAVALKYLSPVFTAIFAVFLLKEKPKSVQWLYFLMAFSGVLMLKGFDTRISMFDLGVGLVSAVLGGLLYIIIRKIGDDDHPLVVVQHFMAVSTIVAAVLMIPHWKTPAASEGTGLLVIGFFGFVAQLYMTKAFQEKEEASYLAIWKYLEAIYALLIGFFWFGETYSVLSFLGIILIFFGLILTVRLKNINSKNPEAE
jgi:drug/metabolite transporter (DMT)-like permease